MGLTPLSPTQGLSALGHAVRGCSAASVCANSPSYWPALLRLLPTPSKFYGELAEAHRSALPARASAAAPGAAGLRAGDVQRQLEAAVAQLVGSEVDPDEPLMAAGLDSLAAMELHNMMSSSLGVDLPSTLVFDYPSMSAMAGYIEGRMGLSAATEAPPQRALEEGPPRAGGELRAASVAARMPQGPGADTVCEVPFERWDVDVDVPLGAGKVGVRFGGFVAGVALFDLETFGMSALVAGFTDPQQRLLLEVSWEALQPGLAGEAGVGVYVGIQQQEYSGMAGQTAQSFNPFMATGGSFSVAAGRLSYKYGLQGPSLSVDTACSSSLVALDVGMKHLQSTPLSHGCASVSTWRSPGWGSPSCRTPACCRRTGGARRWTPAPTGTPEARRAVLCGWAWARARASPSWAAP